MIDREILATRLSKLRAALRKLKQLAATPLEVYLESETEQALTEHFLRLALEAMLDTGNHVIAARGWRKPLQLRDIPLILVENRTIPHELGRRLAAAAGLRNRLVHGYADIDHRTLYGVLHDDLPDMEAFAAAMAELVTEEEPES